MRIVFVRAVLVSLAAAAVGCPGPVPGPSGTADSGNPVADAGFDSGMAAGEMTPDAAEDAGMDAGVDAGAEPRDVTVLRRRLHIAEDGQPFRTIHFNMADIEIAALVPDGGSFTKLTATPTDAGVATISQVPPGPYYLKYQFGNVPTFIVTDQSTVDLSSYESSRPNAMPADAGTTWTLQTMSLPAWEARHQLLVVSPGAGLWSYAASNHVIAGLSAGVVPTAVVFDYPELDSSGPSPLIDATEGDDVYVSLTTWKEVTLDGGTETIEYSSVERAWSDESVTIANGSNTTTSATFAEPARKTHTFDWNRGSFDAHVQAVHPDGQALYDGLFVMAVPFTETYGVYSSTANLAGTQLAKPQGPATMALPMTWSSPYGASWPEVVLGHHGTRIVWPQGDGTNLVALGGQSDMRRVDASGTTQILARISPPTSLLINGTDGTQDHTISPTPALSWQPPSLGTAGHYTVWVNRLWHDGTTARRTTVARVFTKGNEITLPDGVLQSGQKYVFAIRAVDADVEISDTLFRATFPSAFAEALTGLLTVQ